MTRTSSRSNEPVTPADRCPFAERRDFTQCPAHHVVSVKPKGAASRSLEPELSCTFLIAGHLANGRPYPRCAIGSASARELVVERRRNELNEIVAAALMPDSSDDHGEVGVMVADDEARYVAVNQSMCRMLGYESDDQLLGKSVW
ncbi:MAG TPA: PAS domain-containing protein, partial [Candidatus Udaeobacter sp.]|nr:PAS domain-containing protein [Candidatus Udaeobacter sp.]